MGFLLTFTFTIKRQTERKRQRKLTEKILPLNLMLIFISISHILQI